MQQGARFCCNNQNSVHVSACKLATESIEPDTTLSAGTCALEMISNDMTLRTLQQLLQHQQQQREQQEKSSAITMTAHRWLNKQPVTS